MAETGQERTEAATPRKRREAREQGQVARSMDLMAVAGLAAAAAGFALFGSQLLASMRDLMLLCLGDISADHVEGQYGWMIGGEPLLRMGWSLLCMFGVIFAVTLVSAVGQVGFMLSGKAITPEISRLDPIKGLRNVLGTRAIVRVLMGLAKVVVIAVVAGAVVWMQLPWLLAMSRLDVRPAFIGSVWMMLKLAAVLLAVLLVLALLDLVYQRWQHSQDLRMTKQEVKEESKKTEGDPQIRTRRMRAARQMAMQRMAQAVPHADVVVTNPTHFAVALKYDSSKMAAPIVTAKGADLLAFRLREIATAHGVPIVERKPLARALYRNVEVGEQVPTEHFQAVAEILAFVYRLAEEVEADA